MYDNSSYQCGQVLKRRVFEPFPGRDQVLQPDVVGVGPTVHVSSLDQIGGEQLRSVPIDNAGKGADGVDVFEPIAGVQRIGVGEVVEVDGGRWWGWW